MLVAIELAIGALFAIPSQPSYAPPPTKDSIRPDGVLTTDNRERFDDYPLDRKALIPFVL